MKNVFNFKTILRIVGTQSLRLCAIALVAAIGFSFAACDDGTDKGDALNGTWVRGGQKYTFNNGGFEYYENGTLMVKGTYTTSGGNITITTTHAHGNAMNLENRWYTRAELKNLGAADSDLNQIFFTESGPYSVSGNSLNLDGDTFTKQ